MNTNLVDEATRALTANILNDTSQQLGETPSAIQTALNAALPTILGGLIQRASEPGGISSVMDLTALVTTPNRATGEVIEPVGGILAQLATGTDDTTGQFTNLLAMGSDAVQSLFGSKAGAVIDALASYSGLASTSASAVLSLAGTTMLGVLGRHMATGTDGPLGVVSLLNSQTGVVRQAIPAGLSTLLSAIPGLDVPGARPNGVGNTVSSSATIPVPTRAEGQYSDHVDPINDSTPNRWLPWLLLALGVVGLFFILRSCRNEGSPNAEASGVNLTDSTAVVSDKVGAVDSTAVESLGTETRSIGEGVVELGAFFKRKLPTGVELNIPENGVENKLVSFIEDTSKPVDKTTWFNFDRLLFDTGKATLQPASQEQIGNIADVLKAYPGVAIKLGGYTDNTGVPQANQKLSAERANTVMNELLQLGIAPSRITAEGYGEQYPVAPNDTEAGRAQNRRIAVRVTKK